MPMSLSAPIDQLIKKGVNIPAPHSIEIGKDVDVGRIAATDVTIHAGSKIFGSETFIDRGARIGYEGPATLVNCYVGADSALKGGFFQDAVFLAKSSCGLGAHIRKGTILEEHASVAHTVGLKQTILLPFVTLGSLINFCDCLMAGGTGTKNHSEVGSSYIHFNFTPDQDKATASLIGDVPRGVMLNQAPIFLGGQGGLVGPCRINYGNVIAAGSICRKDQLKEDRLVIEGSMPNARMPLQTGLYRNLKRILTKNLIYIGNLLALRQWYRLARNLFIGPTFPQAMQDGLLRTLQLGIDERIKQLERLKLKIEATSADTTELHASFCRNWDGMKAELVALQQFQGSAEFMEPVLTDLENQIKNHGTNYVDTIRALDDSIALNGTQWLQSVVDHVTDTIQTMVTPT